MRRSGHTRVPLVHRGIEELCVIVVLLFAGLLLASVSMAAQVGSEPAVETDIPSFDIWCLEIQRSAATRCDARRTDDMEAYEHYRALAEQFEQQRADQDRRDQDLMERLNREPGDSDLFGQENLEKRE
jgi:hypothetical protein